MITNVHQRSYLLILPFVLHNINFLENGGVWGLLAIIIALYIIVVKNRNIANYELVLILIFSILYVFFFLKNGFLMENAKRFFVILLPSSYYILGRFLIKKESESALSLVKFSYFFIFVAFFVPFVSNLIYIFSNGFMVSRNIPILWKPFDEVAGTLIGGHFSLNMSLLPIALFYFTNKHFNYYRRLSVIFWLIGFFVLINISTRSGIYITAISLLLSVFFFQVHLRKNFVKILFIALFLIFGLALSGFFDFFTNSTLFERLLYEDEGKGFANNRSISWLLVLNGLLEYPLGGSGIILNFQYAHNFWLDVAYRTGLVPALLLLFVTVKFIVLSISIALENRNLLFVRVLSLCVTVGFIGIFMVEPIMEGLFNIYCLFCLFFGLFRSFKSAS